jgi:hypothetical protein
LSTAQLSTLLAPLNTENSAWRYMAREILAYRTFRDGKTDAAQKEFEALAKSNGAPGALRQRASAMATLIRTSGGNDYGTVPLPKPAAPAQGTPSP